MTHKRRESVTDAAAGPGACSTYTEGHKGGSKAKKTQMKDMQIGIWLYSFSSPKVRSCALKKKSSFVLALTLKKYKLKSNRNISLVQSIWPGISRAIGTSSYHALSRADGGVYTEAWLRSLGIAESVLGSNPLLVTILGSWEYGSYMWASFCLVIWK